MKKRLLALILTLVMVVSLLPGSVLAAPGEGEPTPGQVVAKKELVGETPDADGNYTIRLSIQGTPVTETTESHADVVLVIDNSGSMASSVGTPCNTPEEKFEQHTFLGTGYYQCPNCKAIYISIIGIAFLPDICQGETGKYVRIDTAKEVGKTFAADILTDGNDNRIAVIGFSHHDSYGGADDTDALYVKQDLTDELSEVYGAIDKMEADGGTNYSAALQQAYNWLNAREDQTRPAYVIFISDGAPGYSGESIGDEDWDGSEQAKDLKDAGVSLYTIGIALKNEEGRYLKSLASDEEHYINVTGENYKEQLEDILKQWAEEINQVPAGTDAVITDIIADEFSLVPDSCSVGLTVGPDGKTLTWNIGDIPADTKTVEFKISHNGTKFGELPTNENVSLTYTDPSGEKKTVGKEKIGDPKVTIENPEVEYTVYYYKDSVDSEPFATETGSGSIDSPIPYDVNKQELGYTFDSVTPENPIIKGNAEENVVKVLYVKDEGQTHERSYTVEYYKDGVLEDTVTVTKAVWVGSNEIPVEDGDINTSDKFEGCSFVRTDPTPLPATITADGVIKVYYETDSTTEPEEVKGQIRVYMDKGTQADFDALRGWRVGQVRIYSEKYPNTENGYRACAPWLGYWHTENRIYKLTSADVEKIVFARDKAIGGSEKIEIPADGNKTYGVKITVEEDYLKIYIYKKDDKTQYVTVTFDKNYEGAPAAEQRTIEKGETVTRPEDPTREGYTFTGWYYEAGAKTPFGFETPISNDLTLYAGWKEVKTYPVMLQIYRNGETEQAWKSFHLGDVVQGKTYNASDLEIEDYYDAANGYVFEGFYNDGGWNQYLEGNPNNKLDLTTPITVNGYYNIKCMVTDYEKVVVRAVVDGDKENAKVIWQGKALHGTNTIDFLNANAEAMELDRTGYKLDKWYNWDWYGHKYADTTTINGWTKAYVTYTSDWQTVQVQIYRNGDTSKVYDTVPLADMRKGETLDLTELDINSYYTPDKFATGFEFEGWYKDGGWNDYKEGNPNNKLDEITINGWTNIICMVWDEFPVYYNLVDADGQVVESRIHTDTITARDLDTYNFYQALDRTGYTFDGWYQDEKDVGVEAKRLTGLNTLKKWELYGRYDAIPQHLEVYAAKNKDLENAVKLYDGMVDYGTNLIDHLEGLALTLPTYPGYSCETDKWYKYDSPNWTFGETDTVSGWTKVFVNYTPNAYDIVYHGNGGLKDNQHEQVSSTFAYDAEAVIKRNEFVRSGYSFEGWALSANGPVVYTGGEKVAFNNVTFPGLTENGKVELYAIWKSVAPEKPEFGDIVELFEGSVRVDCVSKNYHKTGVYGLLRGGYTVTAPVLGTDGKYTCTVTLLAKAYLEAYNDSFNYSRHYLARYQGNETVTLKWDEIDQEWGVIYGQLPVTFDVVCKRSTTPVIPSLPEDLEDPDDTTPNWLNLDDHDAYIQGYPDGCVKPQNNITRAEVATIFYRLLTDDARDYYYSTDSGFSDVNPGDWYNTAVATMVQAGILNGYSDGTFKPNASITRAEFATIAARFLSNPYSTKDRFYDTEGHWAEVYINRAAEAGWIDGYPDGSFRPDQAITRAEAVTLVNAVLGRAPHEDHLLPDMITWPDNPKSAWYYEAIQEATNSHDYDWAASHAYEIWTELLENRQWSKLEKEWSDAYDAPGGEVMD